MKYHELFRVVSRNHLLSNSRYRLRSGSVEENSDPDPATRYRNPSDPDLQYCWARISEKVYTEKSTTELPCMHTVRQNSPRVYSKVKKLPLELPGVSAGSFIQFTMKCQRMN